MKEVIISPEVVKFIQDYYEKESNFYQERKELMISFAFEIKVHKINDKLVISDNKPTYVFCDSIPDPKFHAKIVDNTTVTT